MMSSVVRNSVPTLARSNIPTLPRTNIPNLPRPNIPTMPRPNVPSLPRKDNPKKKRQPKVGPNGEEPPKKKRKRGVKNERFYKRNEVRIARLKGQPYVSYTGKLVEGKTIPRVIVCKCRSKCHSKLQEKNIHELWNHFYSIDNKNAQDTHLQNWIEVREIKRRKRKKRIPLEINLVEGSQQLKLGSEIDQSEADEVNIDQTEDHEDYDEEEEASICTREHPANLLDSDGQLVVRDESQLESPTTFRKNYTFIYNVRVNGRITQICKNAFLQVFGVTESRIRRICDLLVHSKIPCDLRGKNRSVNTIEPDVREKIHSHILTFQVREIFHEGRLKKYLDPGLNIVKMHDMFLRDNPELQNKVKYSFYYQYFKENFDYEFGQPQAVDQTNQPYESAQLPPTVQMPSTTAVSETNHEPPVALPPELMALKKRAKDFYEALKNATDKKDYDTLALAFNYIQNFLVPQHHQPGFSYNNYYYHQQQHDPAMLEWTNHHPNHQ